MTVIQLADRLRDESDAYKFVEELRWPDGVAVCPHCGNEGATFIEPTNGKDRATRTGARSQRRVWRCLSCRKQFSVITGTCMHATKLSLRIWIMVFAEMCAAKNGIAAREIQRRYGIHPRTAWHLMHRIREAMKTDGLLQSMRGTVEADETFFGGQAKFMHNSNPRKREQKPGGGGKVAVLALVANGESRSRIIPDVTGASLRKAIAEQVDMAGSVLHTDSWIGYNQVGKEFIAHEVVNHAEDEYVRYDNGRVITSNRAENFFSQLQRSIDGSHHHVSTEHLPRYLAEFDFRYSTRKMTDTERMAKLMGQVHGKRLTYKRITAA